MAKIGFIGLGNMGGPMAANLLKAGHEVAGFDLEASALQAFGGRAENDAGAAAAGAEIVISMLPAGPQVRDLYLGAGALLDRAAPGALLIDCSTIDVETSRSVAAVAKERGFDMLDAPVSGGVGGATAGTLTFMVGGSEGGFARARPVLEAMGKTIVHAGGCGSGQAVKICNNMVLGISMIGLCEAFALAERLGVESHKLFEISAQSSGQCWSLTSYCPVPGPVPASPANRDYQPGFTAAMMLKDLKLAQQAAQAVGASTPLGAEAAALYQLLTNSGLGGKDFSVMYRYLRPPSEL